MIHSHLNNQLRRLGTCALLFVTITSLSVVSLFSQQFPGSTLPNRAPPPNQTQAGAPVYFQPGSTAPETYSGMVREQPAPNRYSANRSDSSPYSAISAQRELNLEVPLNSPAEFGVEPRMPNSGALAVDDFPPGELVAVVGEEPILAADLFTVVDPMLVDAKEQASESQYQELRLKLMRQSLAKLAQTKMLAQYFVGEQLIGKSLDERKTAKEQIDKRMTSAFFELMLPRMLEQQKVDTALELDQTLRGEGSSLASQMRTFKDSMMAQEAMKKYIPTTFEITAIEMRDQYDEKIKDWRRPARAKFRILTAQFSKTSDRDQAWTMIVELGNEALTGGNFEAVARQKSHGRHAVDGGRYDWTAQGSLKSTQIDEVVFQIPLRRLSQIFEDEDGFHIVEVLEREETRTVPFEDAQDDIRDSLIEFRKRQAQEKLLEKLQQRTAIWSKWPDDIPNAKPLEEYYGIAGKPN